MKTFDELFAELRDKGGGPPGRVGDRLRARRRRARQGKKLLEEAGEVWLAAEHEPDDALAEEISRCCTACRSS